MADTAAVVVEAVMEERVTPLAARGEARVMAAVKETRGVARDPGEATVSVNDHEYIQRCLR